jgi:hypoxanthine-guanine phosphoribosyltransferase
VEASVSHDLPYIIIDDIVASGKTLRKIFEYCQASLCRGVYLYGSEKIKTRKDIEDDFCKVLNPIKDSRSGY